MAYQLKPSSQEYVTAGPVKNGNLELVMPKTAEAGLYRMVYAIPTDEFYFDVIYNGKEDIQLAFNTTNGVSFTSSEENGTYLAYLKEINSAEKKLADYYANGQKEKTKFNAIVNDLKAKQNSFETSSKPIAHIFHYNKSPPNNTTCPKRSTFLMSWILIIQSSKVQGF